MACRFKHSFIFGKFLPFHRGHEAMLHFALSQSEHVSVIICASNRETIPVSTRLRWIQDSLGENPLLTLIPCEYSEDVLANTSESSYVVSEAWAKVFQSLVPDCDGLITSEVYGDYVAEFMGISHIPFDISRTDYAISASMICQAPFLHWGHLPDAVREDLALTVVILGTESVGKTTLTKLLAAHYQASAVYEAARDIIENSNNFSFTDLERVVQAHAEAMRCGKRKNSPLVIVDTDVHITASYAHFCFERVLNISEETERANRADLYLYLDKDVPFVQDGTRLHEKFRTELDGAHKAFLKNHEISFHRIQGSWDERFLKACALIDEVLEVYSPWRFWSDLT